MQYADGTHGAGAVDTSKDLERDQHATFTDQQSVVLALAFDADEYGITGHDVQAATGWGDSPKSRAMSNLLKDGKLVRLAEKRDRGHVHVLPGKEAGRDIEPYQSIAEKHRLAGYDAGYNLGVTHGLERAFEVAADADNLGDAMIALRALITERRS